MPLTKEQLWQRFKQHYVQFPKLGLALDISRVDFPDDFLARMEPFTQRAWEAMQALEAGAIANPDEQRMVGHYWLRNAELLNSARLIPPKEAAKLRDEIGATIEAIKAFAADVHAGKIQGAGGVFQYLLVIGIGGSALGPQFVASALGNPKKDRMQPFFFDNTDPDGMDRVLAQLEGKLGQTLVIVISKSGGTKETRNGMVEAKAAFERAGLVFAQHAVAITGADSDLDKEARNPKWMARFPMWDWVGGRTSETSAVGLLPAALQGFDIEALLQGARECDLVTRQREVKQNPALQLAWMWHFLSGGVGAKDMVVLPYKDRLELFSRYLQQLVMESLGKEKDLDGQIVNQGLTVYGNKGSTDQHAYIQQLRDGVPNFFVVFIEVLKAREGAALEVEKGIRSEDYLRGFLLGTRQALYEKGRQSITLTVDDVSPYRVGVLIALFERAVGFYASLVNINAYHQPGVQAGKVAADKVLEIQQRVLTFMAGYTAAKQGRRLTAEEMAQALGEPGEAETIFKICSHLAANQERGIRRLGGSSPADMIFEPAASQLSPPAQP
jgi:glucose-6-phosphate isomerase